jgi:hypothetical protein
MKQAGPDRRLAADWLVEHTSNDDHFHASLYEPIREDKP